MRKRRYFLTSLKVSILALVVSSCSTDTQEPLSFQVPLTKGPLQNNGATPWYAEMTMGTPAQPIKIALDTGSDFLWVTSELCATDGCQHYGNGRFNQNASTSFQWVGTHPSCVDDFGPWGEMIVQTGNDSVGFTSTVSVSSDIYMAQAYSGEQFAELNWDGGIGIPSQEQSNHLMQVANTDKPQPCSDLTGDNKPEFHIVETLLNEGKLNSDFPLISFETNADSKHGSAIFGFPDLKYVNVMEYIFLPWDKYSLPSLTYLWTSKIETLSLGTKQFVSAQDNYFLSLDSGSSRFKGDVKLMEEICMTLVKHPNCQTVPSSPVSDDLIITFPNGGEIVVPAYVYNATIEAGTQQGETVPQFEPMAGLEKLALVGSVLMDNLYTIFEYRVQKNAQGYSLEPVGMWVFNKPGGIKIIQSKQETAARIFKQH